MIAGGIYSSSLIYFHNTTPQPLAFTSKLNRRIALGLNNFNFFSILENRFKTEEDHVKRVAESR